MKTSAFSVFRKLLAPELRKLIGKKIDWDTKPDYNGYFRTKSGIPLEIKWRNVLIDNLTLIILSKNLIVKLSCLPIGVRR